MEKRWGRREIPVAGGKYTVRVRIPHPVERLVKLLVASAVMLPWTVKCIGLWSFSGILMGLFSLFCYLSVAVLCVRLDPRVKRALNGELVVRRGVVSSFTIVMDRFDILSQRMSIVREGGPKSEHMYQEYEIRGKILDQYRAEVGAPPLYSLRKLEEKRCASWLVDVAVLPSVEKKSTGLRYKTDGYAMAIFLVEPRLRQCYFCKQSSVLQEESLRSRRTFQEEQARRIAEAGQRKSSPPPDKKKRRTKRRR